MLRLGQRRKVAPAHTPTAAPVPGTTPAVVGAPSPPADLRAARIGLALHVASLVVAFIVLVYVDRQMWFRADDFDFLTERGLHGATLSIWFPHDVHWTTLPLLLWRAIFVFAKMRTARPYLIALYATHLALAHVLWRVMRSTGTGPYVASALAALFALLGSGSEDILSAFQIAFVAPVLLGWVAVLLLNREARSLSRDVAAVLVGVAALMSSGVAVTMVAVGGIVALLRRGWRAAAFFAVPCGIVFLTWYALVGHKAHTLVPKQSLEATVLAAPNYVLSGLSHALGTASGSQAFGPVLYLAVIWFAVRQGRRARGPVAPVVAGAAGSLIFFCVAAFGRDVLGPAEAEKSRYVYIAVALLLPAIGLGVTTLVRCRRGLGVAALAVLAVVGTWNFGQLLATRDSFVPAAALIERQLVAAAHIAATQPTLSPNSTPIANVAIGGPLVPTLGVLEQMYRQGDLPTGVTPQPVDYVDAATEIQLGFTGRPRFAEHGATAQPLTAGIGSVPVSAGCDVYTASGTASELQLSISSQVSVLFTRPAGAPGSIKLSLLLGGVQGVKTFVGLPRDTSYLDVEVTPAVIDVFLGAGDSVDTCGAAPVAP
jgi:hypothetical protein